MGVEGAAPLPRGHGRSATKNIKIGDGLPTLASQPRVGPKKLANHQPTGVGKGGPGGFAPWRGVVGGVPPQNIKGGRVATLATPPTSGTQNAGEPSAYGGGERGSRGRSPHGRGFGGCAPRTKRGNEQPTPATPPRVGPETPTNPKPTRAGKMLIPHNPVKHQPLSQLAFPSPQML